MPFRNFLFPALAVLTIGTISLSRAADRTADWKKVRDAVENKQAKTAVELLKPLETAAFADQAWGEGAKALIMRVRIENGLGFPEAVFEGGGKVEDTGEPGGDPFAAESWNQDQPDADESDPGGLPGCVRQLDREIPAAPDAVRSVLRWFQARWLLAYAHEFHGAFWDREKIPQQPDDPIERWNQARVTAVIESHFRQSLDDPALRSTPVAAFREVLGPPGAYGDAIRPTLHDLVAHSLIEFLTDGPFDSNWEPRTTGISASSPVFGGAEEFLAWKPDGSGPLAKESRALAIYQQLLSFHRDDSDRSAFLHCDLERLRWAGRFASGGDKPKRHLTAIQSFIKENTSHPLSADARQDEVLLLNMFKRPVDGYASAKAGADAFPDHPSGKLCKGLMLEMEARELEFHAPGYWPTSGDEITVNQMNLDHLWFRLYRHELQPGFGKSERNRQRDSKKEVLAWLKERPDYAWDTALDFPKDYQRHPLTVTTPGNLTPGLYRLVVSDSAEFSDKSIMDWCQVRVSNLRITNQEWVVDAVTGAPRPGVKVEIWQKPEKGDVTKEITRTDDGGRFTFTPQPMPKGGSILFMAIDGDDLMVRESYPRSPATPESRGGESVRFFTDRAIYRPGQPIHFKGIFCAADKEKADYHTVEGRNVTVTLTDSNDKEVAKQDFRTNAMGSFAGTFPAPTGSLLGQFKLGAEGRGYESIHVEEYKRPKFEVELAAPEKPVALGDQVTLKGTARTYTGTPVNGATVEWKVIRNVGFTGLGAWLGWNDDTLNDTPVTTGRTTTAADGSFTLTFAAEPDGWVDPEKDPVFFFQASASVTDPTGENHEAERFVCVGYSGFQAGIEVAEWQETGKPVFVTITTGTHGGHPFPTSGILRVHPLKQPATCPRNEEKPFLEEPFSNQPPPGVARWEADAPLRELAVTTQPDADGDTVATVPVDLPAGCYKLVFEGRDAKQRKVTAFAGLRVIDPAANRFPIKTPFFAAASAEEIESGQSVSVAWGSGHEVARALIEWYRGNTVLKREWSVPGRTQQVFTFTADESLRGGFSVRVRQFSQNRYQQWTTRISVPWSNNDLAVKWERLTSKLQPGAKDTWTAVITGPDGKPATAEMVATLYDASLDELYPHGFGGVAGIFRDNPYWSVWWNSDWDMANSTIGRDRTDLSDDFREITTPFRTPLPGLDEARRIHEIVVSDGGRYIGFGQYSGILVLSGEAFEIYNPPELPNSVGSAGFGSGGFGGFPVTPATPVGPVSPEDLRAEALRRDLAKIVSRGKLHETAFFYPQLTTDKDGKVRMSFTMPEGLGRWRFLGFAHDKDLRSGHLEGEAVTAKDLMVQPNPPRFLREGDTLDFTVRLSNQSDREQSGLAKFTLSDAAGAADLTAALGVVAPEQAFTIPAKQSRTLVWRLTVPDGCGFLRYQARAACGDLTDGEEGWLPVLPRLVPVTDSMAVTLRAAGEAKHDFASLAASGKSDTLRHDSLQVQVVSRPAWYAVMALPYLMEFPHECAEQTFSRLYANAMGHRIVTSDPRIRRVFDVWRAGDSLDSPLRKNQELTSLMLDETPWLLDAGDDTARRQRVALLFDDNRMADELAKAHAKLKELQLSEGMWPWFAGGWPSEFITAHITAGYGELRAAGIEVDTEPAIKGAAALDSSLTEAHRQLLRAARKAPGTLNENHLSPFIVHALYSRSFFLNDRKTADWDQGALAFFIAQGKQHWNKLSSRLTTAQLALALWRHGEKDTARLITRALRETASNHPQTGMSWPTPPGSGWWWDAPIETQAAMIAAFGEIDGDAKAVDDCRAWIIHQHRDGDWKTTTATAAAIHALLIGPVGPNPLASDAVVRVSLGGKPLDPGKVEPGTGYYEHRISGAEVKPEMAAVTLTNTDPGVAWVNLHWRYFEDISKLAAHKSGGLEIEKHLSIRRATPAGTKEEPLAGPLRPGDELITRLVVTSARDLEFVHLKDDRGSGTDPANVLSGYRWKNGVGYYETTRDSATHFFIDSLPKGTHVFEHVSRVQHAGTYQTGPATIRCMYAPEFMARSATVRIESVRNP